MLVKMGSGISPLKIRTVVKPVLVIHLEQLIIKDVILTPVNVRVNVSSPVEIVINV